MPETIPLVTADEFEKWPEEEGKTELVDGRVVSMSQVGYRHGRVVGRIVSLLDQHVRVQDLGVVVLEVGFTLRRHPDTVRAPDVAFLRKERIPAIEPLGVWEGPPDLAIEVLSPDDRPGEMRRKVRDYLTGSVAVVLVVDLDKQSITVSRASTPAVTLRENDTLDIGDVVSGFHCTVREIFE